MPGMLNMARRSDWSPTRVTRTSPATLLSSITSGPILPMPAAHTQEAPVTITPEMKAAEAYHTIRMARADFRLFGVRQKNRLAKEAKE